MPDKMPDDIFQRLIDDRPQFTFTLSFSEAQAVRDALGAASMLCEGNMEGVAAYVGAHDCAHEADLRDRVSTHIVDEMRPTVRAIGREVKALIEEHRARIEKELDELG